MMLKLKLHDVLCKTNQAWARTYITRLTYVMPDLEIQTLIR